MAAVKKGLELFGHPVSQPARAVLWFLMINDMPYTFHKVDPFAGDNKKPEFLKLNPSGKIPVLVDYEPPSGSAPLVVYESVAILQYLVNKNPRLSSWYPSDVVTRAKLDEYLHWHHGHTRQFTLMLFRPRLVAKLTSTEVDPKEIAKGQKVVSKVLTVIEESLLPNPNGFLTGLPSPSIADLMCYCELDQLEILNLLDFTPFPRITSWMTRIKALPKYDESHRALFSFKKMMDNSAASKL